MDRSRDGAGRTGLGRHGWAIAAAVVLWLAVLGGAGAQEGELTLEQVIRMNAEGVPEDALIERIGASGTVFVLDGPALARVQKANLPPRVLVALMKTAQDRKEDAPDMPKGTFTFETPSPAAGVPAGATPDAEEPPRAAGTTAEGAPGAVPEGWTLFRQTDGRFAVQIPQDWKVVSTRAGKSTVQREAFEMGLVPPDEIEDLGKVGRFLLVTYLPRKADAPLPSLEEWLSSFCHKLQRLEPEYRLSGDEVTALGDGTPAARVTAEGVPRDAGRPMKVVFYGVPMERGFFLVRHGAPAEAYPALAETFAQMMASFTLTPAQPEAPEPAPDLLAQKTEPFAYGSGGQPAAGSGGERTSGGADPGPAGTTDPSGGAGGTNVAPTPDRPLPRVAPTDPGESAGGLPVATHQPVPEQPVPSFVEYAEPDGRFRIQFPATWKRADLATADGILYYFAPHAYNPRAGKPFTNGVSVVVQANVYTNPGAAEDMARLATAGEAIRSRFVQGQESARSLVRVHDPALLRLAGDHPSLVYRYTLTYPNGGDELGFFVVALAGDFVFVAEANAPREQYDEAQGTLLRVVESLVLVKRESAPEPR